MIRNIVLGVIGGLLVGYIGISIIDNIFIKKEAIYCLEQRKGKNSTGDCRIVNTQAGYINSKDSNVTIVVYNQGNGNPDHVVAIKNDIVIDYTSKLNGIIYNDLKEKMKKHKACIVYQATILNNQIVESNKNLSCSFFSAFGYAHYFSKVIQYKNENKNALQNGSCSKIVE